MRKLIGRLSHAFHYNIFTLIEAFFRYVPDIYYATNIRVWLLRCQGACIGKGTTLRELSYVYSPELVTIGDNTAIGLYCTLVPGPGRIHIGNDVLIAQGAYLRAGNHKFKDPKQLIRLQGHEGRDIIIEDDVWIGANVTIIEGVRIGTGAVVAAGAVVVRDVAPYTVVGGVPAKQISVRSVPNQT